jgi:hypothetical protein
MTSWPALPPAGTCTEIVTFASPAASTRRSVSAVRRSFSSASLALLSSSRRNTSLWLYSEWITRLRRREMSDWGES